MAWSFTWLETKIPPPLVTLVAILGVWFSRGVYAFTPHPVSTSIALVCLIVALALLLAALWQFRRAKTTVNPLKPSSASFLITSGVFSISRNPIYLADVIIVAAFSIYCLAPFGVISITLLVLYLNRFQIEVEEGALKYRFGNEFEVYCSKIGRWV